MFALILIIPALACGIDQKQLVKDGYHDINAYLIQPVQRQHKPWLMFGHKVKK